MPHHRLAAVPENAITLLKGRAENYRALVADIGLRGRTDGWVTTRRAREIDPTFPVIYITAAQC
ncbi:hypothetical protein [Bradyrhizobium zhanjiangense]|uniref:hypothetical protein n=1 Tax=Bradyrhizobium zhanjiangense TaxID=1325107 RepID=UPI00100934E0|nr:hypothetical protein [Bradyrhizobium zhanjiangense]